MTYLIEVAPETERVLATKAARLGVPVEKYLRDVVEREAQSSSGTQSTLSGFGAAAHLAPRASDVNRERREEVAREEARRAAA
jgi:hypothetical protein